MSVFIFWGESFNASPSVKLLAPEEMTLDDKSGQDTSLNVREVVQIPQRGMSG